MKRCSWCGDDPLYVAYHDDEWGKPIHDGRQMWESLTLESFQAGLSWITILRKREDFRIAFEGFDPKIVAEYDQNHVQALLQNAGIIRHRGKIEATISSARLYNEMGGAKAFSDYLWGWVDDKPIINSPHDLSDVPATTDLAIALAKDLKKRGFKFVGPSITYAFMQAVGMVNDHMVDCFARDV